MTLGTVYEYAHVGDTTPNILLALRVAGIIPEPGQPVNFAPSVYDARSVRSDVPVVYIRRGLLSAPTEYLSRALNTDFFHKDPLVTFAYVYKNSAIEKAAVVYPDMTLVDMSPYLKQQIKTPVWGEIEAEMVHYSLPIAFHMLAIYGPKRLNDIMADPHVVNGYAKALTTFFRDGHQGCYAMNFRTVFQDLLQIVKPDPQKLRQIFGVISNVKDSTEFWGVGHAESPFNIRSISGDFSAANAVLDYVIAHNRWPASMDEVARGEPTQIMLQPVGVPMTVGRPYVSSDGIVLTITSCNVREGKACLNIDRTTGPIESGMPVYLCATDGKYDGFVGGIPSCVKTVRDMVSYIQSCEELSHAQKHLVDLLSQSVSDLEYQDLKTIISIVARASELQKTSNGLTTVVKKSMIDPVNNIVVAELAFPGGTAKNSFPFGVPAKVMTSFLLTYGMSSQKKHVKSLFESMQYSSQKKVPQRGDL